MVNIQKLTYPYFTDGTTQLNAANLNPIIAKINDLVDKVNGESPSPTPTTVSTPVITISGSTATITCATSGATIRYAIDAVPSQSSGTIISSGGTVALSKACTIKAIAYKEGVSSSVATRQYAPSGSSVIDLTSQLTWTEGGAIIHDTGEVYAQTAIFRYSNALNVSPYQGRTMQYTRIKREGSQARKYGLAFYDSEGTYISGQSVDYNTSNGYEQQEITIPSNAATVRFTFYTADSSKMTTEGWTDQFSVVVAES
jgi:hypothetical protein